MIKNRKRAYHPFPISLFFIEVILDLPLMPQPAPLLSLQY